MGEWHYRDGFHRPFRTENIFGGRYQTLRVWLISGCAFGTKQKTTKRAK